MGVFNSLQSTVTCVKKGWAVPGVGTVQQLALLCNYCAERWKFSRLRKWDCQAFLCFQANEQIRYIRFAVHLGFTFLKTTRGFCFFFSQIRTHTLTERDLATGVQQRSAMETKDGTVLTGGDPCFRVERCQKWIDGSHPEGDFYRKILLAGILLPFILDVKRGVTVMAALGQSVPQVIMKGMWLCIQPSTRSYLKRLSWTFTLTIFTLGRIVQNYLNLVFLF